MNQGERSGISAALELTSAFQRPRSRLTNPRPVALTQEMEVVQANRPITMHQSRQEYLKAHAAIS